jgi:translation initiation factor eIF-2B subunit delta
MLSELLKAGIPCSYLLINGVGPVIPGVSMVFLGAHAINSNGSVYSRAGTALVAMLAKEHSVPVLILSETYKYSNNLQLDSFAKNELGKQIYSGRHMIDTLAAPAVDLPSSNGTEGDTLNPNLQIINPLYDLTPHTHITVLVTEVGLIPPSAISTLAGLRDKDKGFQMSV